MKTIYMNWPKSHEDVYPRLVVKDTKTGEIYFDDLVLDSGKVNLDIPHDTEISWNASNGKAYEESGTTKKSKFLIILRAKVESGNDLPAADRAYELREVNTSRSFDESLVEELGNSHFLMYYVNIGSYLLSLAALVYFLYVIFNI